MKFEILGEISDGETFAAGSGIRELPRLRKAYGRGRWRKRKGIARIRLADGSVHLAEIHWYEAAGRNSSSSTSFERQHGKIATQTIGCLRQQRWPSRVA